jgi:hypothetical protein
MKPIKFIEVAISNVAELSFTTVAGLGSVPYKWACKLTVTAQVHSDSSTTPVPGSYTGRNVSVGDWIISDATGRAVKIVAIASQTDTIVNCTVEDIESYNVTSSNDSNPYGMVPNGTGVKAYVFEVKNGVPVLGSIPVALPGSLAGTPFVANIQNRFTAAAPAVVGVDASGTLPVSLLPVATSTTGGIITSTEKQLLTNLGGGSGGGTVTMDGGNF